MAATTFAAWSVAAPAFLAVAAWTPLVTIRTFFALRPLESFALATFRSFRRIGTRLRAIVGRGEFAVATIALAAPLVRGGRRGIGRWRAFSRCTFRSNGSWRSFAGGLRGCTCVACRPWLMTRSAFLGAAAARTPDLDQRRLFAGWGGRGHSITGRRGFGGQSFGWRFAARGRGILGSDFQRCDRRLSGTVL